MFKRHHGSALGWRTALSSLTAPSASVCSSFLGSACVSCFPLRTFPLALRHPNLATAQIKPTPAPPRIPVGAITKAAPLAIDPIAVPLIAATRAPTAAYFAYRTSRQNAKMVMYLRLRRKALVRSWVGCGPVLGSTKYLIVDFAFASACVSLVGA